MDVVYTMRYSQVPKAASSRNLGSAKYAFRYAVLEYIIHL